MANRWTSSYIYPGGRLSVAIRSLLGMIVSGICDEVDVRKWFFIRYWDPMPHIRLRLETRDEMTTREIQQIVARNVRNRFRDLEGAQPLVLSSIKFVPYERETARYGGSYAIEVAEHHFWVSSTSVLSLMKSTPAWPYNRAIRAALLLSMICLIGFGFRKEDARALYRSAGKYWGEIALRSARNSSVYDALDKRLERDAERCRDVVEAAWSCNENLDDILLSWLRGCRQVAAQYESVLQSRRLVDPMDSSIATKLPWSIIGSLIHMTNNRLGVSSAHEPYIMLLGEACLTLKNG